MNYYTIKKVDIANGPGCRVSLFVSGCHQRCKGCFNEELWDFNAGQPFTEETIDEIIEACRSDMIEGLSILGGDPLAPENVNDVSKLVERFKYEYPEKNIWIYTGYKFEDVCFRDDITHMILSVIDVLVDGPFIEDKRDLRLQFCGSSNQRLIDLKNMNMNFNPVIIVTRDKYDYTKRSL